jgi:hypothetical protein
VSYNVDIFFNDNTNTSNTRPLAKILSCKEYGQYFATEDALRKHKNLGKGERESRNKNLCHEIDWISEAQKTGKAQTRG